MGGQARVEVGRQLGIIMPWKKGCARMSSREGLFWGS